MADLLLLTATAGLVATAWLVVCCLRLRSALSFVLGVFLVTWGLVVGESMLLSLAGWWTRVGLSAAILAGLVLALGVWLRLGRPRPPAHRPALRAVRDAARDPVVALPLVAVAVGLAYQVVVALLIPPLDIDVLAYHLPRIVMWMQQHAVAAIPGAPGSNLDGNPPGAEIAKGVTMLLAGSDRYVGLVQVACVPAGALGVAGIAHRVGLGLEAALYGGALFATFPIVALQAPTAHNDLAVATLLVVALFFLLGSDRAELVLGSLGVGLALATKISGILGLAAVALVALVASPAGRRLAVAAALAVGCAVGSWWYAYNLWLTGSWDGGLGADYGQIPSRTPDEILLRLQRYLLHTLDLGGAVGRDRLVFPVVGAVLAVVGIGLAILARRRRPGAGLVLAGGLVAVVPWLIVAVHDVAVRTIARSWIAVGRREVIGIFPSEPEARPWPGEAWFGPVFPVLVVAVVVACVVAVTGRRRRVLLTTAVAAPLLLFVVNAAAFVWDGARGRFFILAGALAASAFGLALRWRPVAWAGATIGVVTLALSFVHFHARPLGIELFEPVEERALWGEPRWRAQQAIVPDDLAGLETARTLSEALPEKTTVAIVAGRFWTMYAVMGQGPWRTIRFVPPGGPVPEDVDWVALAGGLEADLPPAEWELVPGMVAWPLYRRTGS